MKKLLLLGLLSVAGVCASANDAQAWFLDCCRHWCCNRCCTQVCLQPYNAFTPVCCGSICAQGCCPINMCGGFCPMPCAPSCFNPYQQYGMNPYMGGGHCYGGHCGVASLPSPDAVAMAPQSHGPVPMVQGQPVPMNMPGQQFAPPAPQMVVPPMVNQGAYMMPRPMVPTYGYAPVQPVAYYGQQPNYNPYAQAAMMNNYRPVQAPAYWYGY